MFTPWNESGAVEHLLFRSFAIRLAQNLYHRDDVIPLGLAPWNACPACWLSCAVRSSLGSLSNQDDGLRAVLDDLKDVFITLDSG